MPAARPGRRRAGGRPGAAAWEAGQARPAARKAGQAPARSWWWRAGAPTLSFSLSPSRGGSPASGAAPERRRRRRGGRAGRAAGRRPRVGGGSSARLLLLLHNWVKTQWVWVWVYFKPDPFGVPDPIRSIRLRFGRFWIRCDRGKESYLPGPVCECF